MTLDRRTIADPDGVVHSVTGARNIIGELHLRCRRFLCLDDQREVSKRDKVTCMECLARDVQ